MKPQFTRLRGMADLVPSTIAPWQRLEQVVRETLRAYGYGEMRTPLIERTSLFQRSIGEATDIVEKEMYTFPDRNDEMLTLRPENTAGCVRAAIENGMLQPGSVNRVWYMGPMFRYERPQLGRQRQFFQTGAEVYGLAGAAIEAELILLSARLWKALGIFSAMQLEVNTLGTVEDRASYREKLVAYFTAHSDELDEDSVLRDSLSDASSAHFDELKTLLTTAGLEVIENPRLVRGLDYYSHTVFEWTTDKLGSQSAVCAGGRYDGLLEQFGAKNMPGVGWAFGMERVIALMDVMEQTPLTDTPDIFVMATDEISSADSLALAEWVRDLMPDCSVLHNTGSGSLKSQFKKADKSGASIALILGSSEMSDQTVTLKPLLGRGEQVAVKRSELQGELQTMLHR